MCQYWSSVWPSRPDDRDDLRPERLEPDDAVDRRVDRCAVRGTQMSMPKWKLLCMPFGVIPMRGSPKNPRTGCWRWNGLTGQP